MEILHQHCHFTVCSSDVSVINRRNSSLPDETETVDFCSAINCSVVALISSRRRAMVPAARIHGTDLMYSNNTFAILYNLQQPLYGNYGV